MKQLPALWSNTSVFTTTTIASVEPAGVEEVFDIQIERTENFIANGLVSHNTRWHEDDLEGRLLRQMEAGGEQWAVLRLPALAEHGDALGRQQGEALWPERYGAESLERIRQAVGGRVWAALYQQSPRPADGALFQRQWFTIVDAVPID